MADIESENMIYYQFKPRDRCIHTAVKVWRTALNNIGLAHVDVPEITKCLMDWNVCLKSDTIDGKIEELEDQLALQVKDKELRYLYVTRDMGWREYHQTFYRAYHMIADGDD
jgi:hypothetical protein